MASHAQQKTVNSAPTFAVTFPSDFDTAPQVHITTWKSAEDQTSIGGEVLQSSITTSGFTVINLVETGFMSYIAVTSSDSSEVLPTSLRLSRDWTFMRAWLRVFTDVKPDTVVFDYEAFKLMNDVAFSVVGARMKELAPRYLTRATSVAVSSSQVNLAAYRISPEAIPFTKLEFDEATQVEFIPPADLLVSGKSLSQYYRTSAQQNKSSIAWTIEGDYAKLAYGASVVTPTTCTLVYPRVQTEGTDWSQKIDIPDGEPMAAYLAELEARVVKRWGKAA